MNGEHANAVAGPSNSQPTSKAFFSSSPSSTPHHPQPPLLFLPPPVPPPLRQHLHSTQDLLERFQLLPAYDKYVRPSAVSGSDAGFDGADPTTPAPVTPGGVDKGKGRDVSGSGGVDHSLEDTGLGDGGDGDDDDGPGGKGEKKKKNSYKHLIKGVPGKHSMKKDDYLTTTMLVPPKQRFQITPFDARTQRESFTVSPEGLKGWNINALVLESAQAREDRKKRKELKRLAKAQQAGALALSPGTPPPPTQVPIPTSATGSTFRPTDAPTPRTGGTSTPRSALASGSPRPGSHVLKSGSTNPKSGSTVDPRPVPRPGSTAPVSALPPPTARPNLPPVQVPTARVGTPLRTATPTSAHPIDQRGKKRERDDSNGVGVNGLPINGVSKGNGVGAASVNGNGTASNTVVNAKPGTGTIRPRPIKKQRMDMQGQARDVATPVQQQPTPQGV